MTNRLLLSVAVALTFVAPTLAEAPPQDAPLVPPGVLQQPAPAPCGVGDGPCCRSGGQFWATAEYLFGWVNGTNLPNLVTTSPAGTPQSIAGVVASPTTGLLFGGSQNSNVRPGFRLGAGFWFDDHHTIGVEAGFMMLGSEATLFSASSDGSTILARPYFDANTQAPQAVLVAFPGSSSGSIDIRAASGNLYETHIDLTENVIDTGWMRVNSLVGWRFYRYDEALRIRQNLAPTGAAFVPGTQILTLDDFSTHNTFNGCDLGFRTQFGWESLTLDILTKLAVGYVHREVGISGNQVTMVPGAAPVPQTGGLYALQTNGGTHGSNDWGLLPELGGTLTWQISQSLGLRLGYSVMWLDRVARAGDQVNQIVNPNFLPPVGASPAGPAQPAFNLNRQDVWVQNLSIGVLFTY
jgi:hypothetical protein